MAGRSGAAPKSGDTLAVGDVLDAIRGVRWVARRPVGGGLPGAHRARTRGTAAEFTEYRVYRQGDEVRRLDWKLLARTDRAYVRLTEDQTVLPTTVVLDASASMAYPETTRAKWVHAARLAAGLAAVAHASGDPVGLRITGGGALAPRTRRGMIADVVRTLSDTTPGGSAALAPLVDDLRGRVVIIADFLDDADAVISAARAVRARGGEVYAIHIVDAWELEPPASVAMVTDPEAPHMRRPLVSDGRAAYRASFAEWRTALASDWRTAGVEYTLTVSGVGGESVPRALRRVVLGSTGDRHP